MTKRKDEVTLAQEASIVPATMWRSALTPELSTALCKAIQEHPTLSTACHSCGVAVATVRQWIQRGSVPGANPLMAKFAAEFAAANAAEAKKAKKKYHELIDDNSNQAATQLKYMNTKWKDRESDDLEEIIAGTSVKMSDNLRALLQNPTPRLLAFLTEAGWVRKADYIDTTGTPVEKAESKDADKPKE